MTDRLTSAELQELLGQVTWGDQIRAERAAPKASDTERTARMLWEAATRTGVTTDTFELFVDRVVLADMVGLKLPGQDGDGDPQ